MDQQPQLTPVTFAHPHAYIATFFVNRFCLVRNSGFTLALFGLLDDSGKLLDTFGSIFSDTALKELRENLVAYSAKIGPPKIKKPAWAPTVEDAKIKSIDIAMSRFGVVDFVHLANWDEAYAEICFWNYSKASLADHLTQKLTHPFQVWGLALFRCDLDFQREFLEALYPI